MKCYNNFLKKMEENKILQQGETELEESVVPVEQTTSHTDTREESVLPLKDERETEKWKDRIRTFSIDKQKDFLLFGMTVQGWGHIQDKSECQDYSLVKWLDEEKKRGVAIVSDGAGSAKYSHIGSELVCKRAFVHLENTIQRNQWEDLAQFPDEKGWDIEFRAIVQKINKDLKEYVDEVLNKDKSTGSNELIETKDLAATFLLLWFTPQKSFFGHIGDGRAGVKTGDEWKSILIPHKGEYANQTVFITHAPLLPYSYKKSNVYVPETCVINESVEAFVMTSDGCEADGHTDDGLWQIAKVVKTKNGTAVKNIDKPNAVVIQALFDKINHSNRQKEDLYAFLHKNTKYMYYEDDDKSVVAGTYIIEN
jgi:hypothetical protein